MRRCTYIFALIVSILLITSCGSTTIIPKNYTSKKDYSNASVEFINTSLQLSIYKYDTTPSFSKNRFMKKINANTLDDIKTYLAVYELAIQECDFYSEYDIILDEINFDDYAYVDSKTNNYSSTFISVYYFDTSKNILYYCYMQS